MAQRYYIEISPLGEPHFTGIAQVAAGICEAALNAGDEPSFMIGRSLIASSIVEELLRTRDGSLLGWHLNRSESSLCPRAEHFGSSVGIFPNRKFVSRVFDREVQFVHDLSTLVTPQFHTADTIDYHGISYRQDVPTNDLTVCDSQSTVLDVLRYLPNVDPARVRALPLAYRVDDEAHHIFEAITAGREVERFALVLGTLEPRKNVQAVLEFLARSTSILTNVRFMFVGRFGWGASMAAEIEALGLTEAVSSGRIVMTGFLPERAKNVLLHAATLVLYPSVFEGFGLPVLEALAAGVPIVCTRTSSVPEAGARAAFYFDPAIERDLDRAIYLALFDREKRALRRQEGLDWAARFNWAETWRLLKTWTDEAAPFVETIDG